MRGGWNLWTRKRKRILTQPLFLLKIKRNEKKTDDFEYIFRRNVDCSLILSSSGSYNRNRNRESSSTPVSARPTSNSKWQEQELVQDQTQTVIQMLWNMAGEEATETFQAANSRKTAANRAVKSQVSHLAGQRPPTREDFKAILIPETVSSLWPRPRAGTNLTKMWVNL